VESQKKVTANHQLAVT